MHTRVHVYPRINGITLTDHHSQMMNITARLAVSIRFLPDFPFDWSDTKPQRARQSLTIDDFFPSKEESQ